jgi:hypothetical protein
MPFSDIGVKFVTSERLAVLGCRICSKEGLDAYLHKVSEWEFGITMLKQVPKTQTRNASSKCLKCDFLKH